MWRIGHLSKEQLDHANFNNLRYSNALEVLLPEVSTSLSCKILLMICEEKNDYWPFASFVSKEIVSAVRQFPDTNVT
jgi:hypothetical protein